MRYCMKNRTLTFKFTLMFAGFTIITLVVSSILSFKNQTNLYIKQCEESIQKTATYLENELTADGETFLALQDYFMNHRDKMFIRHDFDGNWLPARDTFNKKFAQTYPGKVFGIDVKFNDLPEDLKTDCAVYLWEYYMHRFQNARDSYGLAYAYYIVPIYKPLYMTYILDLLRDKKEVDGVTYIDLGATVEEPLEEHRCMWEAWETGKRPSGYDYYDNEYGRTYAFYSPLYINGKKTGVIGVEAIVAKVNNEIIFATIRQMLMIGGTLILFTILLLAIIRAKYIRKLVKIRDCIEEFSKTKQTEISEELSPEITNRDEISTIIGKFVEMIYELDRYMRNLSKTAMALRDSKQKEQEMSELATKDSLTGIRNKTAYDKEVKKIEWEISSGMTNVGVAMIDLNFLKRINDTYGHSNGNIAIISLCKIVCEIFEHSPVFRIGGDEFVVILKGQDLLNIEELISQFQNRLKELQENPNLEYWEKTSAAIGYALFNKDIDNAYDNVFKRADKEMYNNKKAMKAIREA